MIVDAFIERLAALDPQPFSSVEGIAALAALTGPPAETPAAFVFEESSAAAENTRMTGVLQRVEADIVVVIVLSNVSDASAGEAGREAAAIETAVVSGLIGWQPPEASDVTTFVGGRTVKALAGVIWRELRFATAWYLEAS